jgi:NAD(P)-dependent dehydrogenase (short-subunit alcohol dehydrogenase family)
MSRRVLFITGGSRGIGAGVVVEAARQGYDVAFTYRERRDAAESVLATVRSEAPAARCAAYQLDVRDAAAVERIGDQPRLPVWRAGIILARLDGDQRDRARRDFDALAENGFAAIPPDLFWLGAMCLLAEACARLGDAARAPALYERLERYAERNAQIGLAVSVGTVHRFLGLLSRVMEQWPTAEAHFEAALERSSAMGATASLAHIRCDYAEMLLARGSGDDRERAACHLELARAVADELRVKPLQARADALRGRLRGPAESP